ncbi:hypothetical protein E2C01_074824 [Portunus trituberculatus]|uniref:Uncharacterized protein n=1 Tax=Portunus trituberculatus TaxID=210409 RepID=A0A5B7I6U8_PORTR|nr:hypothetical protein [Portunus trituberculatus]
MYPFDVDMGTSVHIVHLWEEEDDSWLVPLYPERSTSLIYLKFHASQPFCIQPTTTSTSQRHVTSNRPEKGAV